MTQIKITVTGNEATAKLSGLMTSGMVGLPVEISFDWSWGALEKTVVFRAGGLTMDRFDVTGKTTVPPEIMEKKNCTLFVGVYGIGEGGQIVIPTVWAEVGVIQPGADPSGDESTAPTLPVWHTALNAIGDPTQLNTNNKDNLVAAVNEVQARIDQTSGYVNDEAVGSGTWSSKNTVDKCCAAFEENGAVVRCEPVAGYPLEVVSSIQKECFSARLWRCGKNLLKRPMEFNASAVPFEECFFLKAGKYYFSVKPRVEGVWRFYISLYYPDGTVDDTNNPVNPHNGNGFSVYYSSGRWGGPVNTNMTYGFIELVHDSYFAINYGNNETENLFNDVQLEVGSVGTEYEPYIEAEEFFVELGEMQEAGASYNWATGEVTDAYGHRYTQAEPQPIPALPGVNTLYTEEGTITVRGRADTTAVIEKLTNAILALGGNV